MDIAKEVHDMMAVVEQEENVEAIELLQNKSITINDLIEFNDLMRQDYGYEPRFEFHTVSEDNGATLKKEILVHLKKIEE